MTALLGRSVLVLLCLLLAACDAHNEAPGNTVAEAAPLHNWTYREGDAYGYQSAVSDDDKKAGQSASEVVMYRYYGKDGDDYVLRSRNAFGDYETRCTNPCEVMRVTLAGQGEVLKRLVYSDDLVVAAALKDAIAGNLELASDAAKPKGHQADAQSGSSPP